jgi:hypothetical protein
MGSFFAKAQREADEERSQNFKYYMDAAAFAGNMRRQNNDFVEYSDFVIQQRRPFGGWDVKYRVSYTYPEDKS